MLIFNAQNFINLISEVSNYNVAEETEEIDKEREKFFSVVCGKSNLSQYNELSYEELLTMMQKADSYISCEDNFSLEKSSIISTIDNSKRYIRRRLL